MKEEKQSFLRNHADTIAIVSVNLAMSGILMAICLSNISSIVSINSRIDAVNSRMDQFHIMFYDLLKEVKDAH